MAGFAQKFGSAIEAVFGGAKMVPQTPVQPSPTNNLQTPPNVQTQHTAQTDANGLIPQGANNPAPEATKSPLEQNKDLWETPPTDKNAPTPPSQEEIAKRMMEAAGKVDFTKVVDQAELAKITAGGEEAAQALVGILNKTAQAVYGQSMVVTKKLLDQSVEQAEQRFASQIPALVKKQSAHDALFSENPAFQNPVVAPVVSAIQAQLAEKHPKATAQELNKMAKEILADTANIFSPPKQAPIDPSKKEEDWSNYLA